MDYKANPPLFVDLRSEGDRDAKPDFATEITLRDLFAALAPVLDDGTKTIIGDREAKRRIADRSYTTPPWLELLAEYRYEYADAMLKARAK